MVASINIYERQGNFKQLQIDKLPLRKSAPSISKFYHAPASKHCKSQHITLDNYDQAKQLRTFAMYGVPKREQTCYYYLDIENKKVRKLREYHKTIIYSQVYHGTKTGANKRLKKLLNK